MNRSKRKRRRRADKALTGTEKVKIINMRTGKKVKLGSDLFHLLTGDMESRLTGQSLLLSQVGAAFSPMLQDLREYLEENPDNAVAPDWSETVRNSVRTESTLTRCIQI